MILGKEKDTICALSTAPGAGAIALIRLSGEEAFGIFEKIFSKSIADVPSHSAHFGRVKKGDQVIDEVVATVFKNPHSFTGEDTVEIACHGSTYIQQQILQLLLEKGARMAEPGEYTLRAYLNGKMDLSQAEAVADLIASTSAASHRLAMNQMKGGFSREIAHLRQQLIDFASLIELELDFGEEDVEFADRSQLEELIQTILKLVSRLVESFSVGNVIKNGVPVAIVGEPNVGKSTLLNALLKEDRAIVSDIAGTTRDTIEDEFTLEGIAFRFIDTAGLRETTDTIESMGIQKSYEKAREASIVLYLVDATSCDFSKLKTEVEAFGKEHLQPHQKLLVIINKTDQVEASAYSEIIENLEHVVCISAKSGTNIEALQKELVAFIQSGITDPNAVIVTNARHYEALTRAQDALLKAQEGLGSGISGDFLAMDIRQALHYLGEITGEISTDDLLGNIFSKFCIGK